MRDERRGEDQRRRRIACGHGVIIGNAHGGREADGGHTGRDEATRGRHGRGARRAEAQAEVAADARGDRRLLPPARRKDARAEGRAGISQSLHAACRRGPLRAGDRRRRQQGDAHALSARRHAGKNAGARRGGRVGGDPHDRALQHQGEERRRAVKDAGGGAWRRGAARAGGAGAPARRRPEDRERRPQHGVRRADHRGGHAYLPHRQPDRAGAGPRPGRGGGGAGARHAGSNSSAMRITG